MSQRTKRGFIKKDEVLKQIKVGRDGALQTHREAKINSPEYRAASEVTTAIDRLAEQLTGDRGYFHIKMAPASMQPTKYTSSEDS